MKRYLKYKDSGIEWIGEIPEHWELTKLKWIINEKLKYGANEAADLDDRNLPRYIRITDFDENGKLREDTFKSLPHEAAEEYFLKSGDILFARSGATVGKTFQFKNYTKDACFAGYLIKASPNEKKILSDYLYYFTKSNSYENWKNSIFIQSTIQNISADKYQLLDISLPSLSEQEKIITFINQKTKQIDTLIEKKQKLIELLKEQRTTIINQAVTKGLDPNVPMKDSGIEWLGEIPGHWELKRLKFISKIKYGLGQPPKQKEDGLPLIRATNIERGKIIEKDIIYVDPDDIPYDRDPILETNDIIVVRSGAYTADSAIITERYNGAVMGYDLVVKANLINAELLAYALLSNYVLYNQIYLHRLRAAQPHLNAEELGETIILCPPTNEEQEELVRFIKCEILKIDNVIEKTSKEIELLKEYRTTLISEVVTGKIDVRKEKE